jgi:hypothetical protein
MISKIKIPLDSIELNKLKGGVIFTWEIRDNNNEWVQVKIKYDKNGKWVEDGD